MPLIEVTLYDTRINDETVPALIAKITDALCEVTTRGAAPAHMGARARRCRPSSGAIGGEPQG